MEDLFSYSQSFCSLGLNDIEKGLFSAVSLLSADRPGLSNPELIQRSRDKLLETLKFQVISQSSTFETQCDYDLI